MSLWYGLITIVVSTIIGWSIPSIINWINSKKQAKVVFAYHQRINSLYDDNKIDQGDMKSLNQLNAEVSDDYSKGKINKEQYDKLGEEVSVYYRKIFTNEIDSMKNLSENEKIKQLSGIKSSIEDARAEGKISELHYNLLKERLGKYEKK